MEALRRIRESRGLSQAELARRARVGRSSLIDWEAGRTTPRSKPLQRVAEVLGVAMEELLNGKSA